MLKTVVLHIFFVETIFLNEESMGSQKMFWLHFTLIVHFYTFYYAANS